MSALGDVSSLDLQRIWEGVHGRVVHGERLTLGVIELDPGMAFGTGLHQTTAMCLALLEDYVRPGATWSIPSNVPHEVHVGPDGAVVIDVFAPTRDDWHEAERVDARTPRWP